MSNKLPDRKSLQYITKCTSTNDLLKELVQAGSVSEDSGIFTDHQTAGKGQHGKCWHDVPHMNLALSLLLRPARLQHQSQFLFNKLIVSALHQVLADFARDLTIKWPNDIFHKDRKLAGILIENAWQGSQWNLSIVGIGVNVNGMEFPAFQTAATSLRQAAQAKLDLGIGQLAEDIAVNVLNWYRNQSPKEVEAYYHRYLYAKGVYRCFVAGGKHFTAAIKGVTPDGSLQLFDSSGDVVPFSHGNVQFVFN
jgi:BirA family biotin operon repressor/biotin-[acetyl-CoA-carboxylase] ligase